MNLSKPFITRPVATTLLMVALFLAGLLAYRLLPVCALPQVDYPIIRVITGYPGASPEVMTSLVTAPLEKQFGQMPGLNQMTSSSSSGLSTVTLQFSLHLPLDVAEQEVQAAINTARNFLPKDLPSPPVYSKVNPAESPVLILALTSEILPLSKVEDYGETLLVQKLSQVVGVGLVSLSGGARPAIRVQANPMALAAYGLTLESLRNTIAQANANLPKGSFDGDHLSYLINANDQLLSSQDFKSVIVAYKANAPIYLTDIAEIKDGVENVRQAAWMGQTPAIIVSIQRQPGANVIQVVDRIKELLPQIKSSLPQAIDIHVLTDRTLTIRASVEDAKMEMFISILLVILVMFLFLHNGAATLIPSITVPLSLIGTFAAMYLLDFSLNNLTLMALTIATGFVVDDAIVMVENISRYLEQGESRLQAALKGAEQIGFTILSLTISLIAVLIPLLFMADVVGRLFREFAITLALTIAISAVISLTLTPMMCARMLRGHEKGRVAKPGRMALLKTKLLSLLPQSQWNYVKERTINWNLATLIAHYGTTLRWALSHQRFILLMAVATVASTALLYLFIPKGFFPIQDTGIIEAITQGPPSISFEAMKERQEALGRLMLEEPQVENLSSFIGIDGLNPTLNTGRMTLTLKASEQRDESIHEIIKRLQEKALNLSGITVYFQPLQELKMDDRISRTQYQFSVGSAYAKDVAEWTEKIITHLKSTPAMQDIATDQQDLAPQTLITIDRPTASRLGITPQMIDDTLYDAFGQRQISTLYTQRNQYYVILETMDDLRNTPLSLNALYIISTTGKPVPLSAFTTLSQQMAPLQITRQGQFPVSMVSFNVKPGFALEEAVKAIEKAQQDLHVPAHVIVRLEGATKSFQNALANQVWLIIAALVVVYLVLGILYESYIHPVTILSTLPSAGIGATLALMLTGRDFSVVALIGMILLIGIVKKNAIMMIDFALEQERVHGKPPFEAIYQACLMRFRPILMTTLAAMLGAIPLALGTGMGSELRQPLGISILGGLALSQILTLYTTPVIYLTFSNMAIRWKKWMDRRA
jgi:multidrug efflux pump